MNNPHFYEKSELNTPLGRKMRDLWGSYDWRLSDDEFNSWRRHLAKMGCTLDDVRSAVFESSHSEQGRFKPKFADLKSTLRRHRDERTGKNKLEKTAHSVTESGLRGLNLMRQLVSDAEARPKLTRDQELNLYHELTRAR